MSIDSDPSSHFLTNDSSGQCFASRFDATTSNLELQMHHYLELLQQLAVAELTFDQIPVLCD